MACGSWCAKGTTAYVAPNRIHHRRDAIRGGRSAKSVTVYLPPRRGDLAPCWERRGGPARHHGSASQWRQAARFHEREHSVPLECRDWSTGEKVGGFGGGDLSVHVLRRWKVAGSPVYEEAPRA